MEQEYAKGSVAGTGNAISVSLGFTPRAVKLWTPGTGTIVEWTDTMGDGRGKKLGGMMSGLLGDCTPTVGSTPANIANPAFMFALLGLNYQKAATAAGTAPTATTIPQNKWGLFGFEIGADGTIDKKDAAGNATGYDTEALALAALPAASASHIMAFYVTVMRTNAAGFVGATTSFNDAETTKNLYSASLATFPASGLVTPITHTGSVRGFQIGTDTGINSSGKTIYYEAWR